MRSLTFAGLLSLALPLASQGVPEIVSSAEDRTGLALTLYHGDLAMVRETRKLKLPEGHLRLAFADVAASIRPNTVLIELTEDEGITFLERSFEFNLLSPASLTDASLGTLATARDDIGQLTPWAELASLPIRKRIWSPKRTPLQRLARTGPVLREPEAAVLLKRGQNFEASPSTDLVFKQVPDKLRPRPTLTTELHSSGPRQADLRLAYLATGLEWQATYVARLSPSGRSLDLDAWVTLQNRSGSDFRNATLQMVAGDPHQVWEPPLSRSDEPNVDKTTAMVEVCASAPSFKEERISEFHLLTLDQPTSIGNLQKKQLHLFTANGIPNHRTCYFLMKPVVDWFSHPATRTQVSAPWMEGSEDLWRWGIRTLLRPGEDENLLIERVNALKYPVQIPPQAPVIQHPGLLLEFRNDVASGLGRPLPRGMVSVRTMLPGHGEVPMEDCPMDAAATGETCTLEIPPDQASIAGVTGQHRWRPVSWVPREVPDTEKQANHVVLWVELEGEAILANDRQEAMSTLVRLDLGTGFELISTSVPVDRRDASTLDLRISLPPRTRKVLKYRARLPVSFPSLPKE